jgi:hypothetical protein
MDAWAQLTNAAQGGRQKRVVLIPRCRDQVLRDVSQRDGD